ncbi:unnamed protein product [Arctogadus glacialis]
MEEKGIVLPELSCRTAAELPPPELSCRTAAELPPPELLDCRRSFGGSPNFAVCLFTINLLPAFVVLISREIVRQRR